MAEHEYPTVVMRHRDDDWEGFVAYAPDLPGCVAFGDTSAEAFSDLQDAIPEWIDEAIRLGRDVPAPESQTAQLVCDHEELARLTEAQDRLIKAQDEVIKAQNGKLEAARAEITQIRGVMVVHTRTDRETHHYGMWAERVIVPHVVDSIKNKKPVLAKH